MVELPATGTASVAGGSSEHPAGAATSQSGRAAVAYDAFISYSHAKDKPMATALRAVVQKLGKEWYRRRALRVFLTTPASQRRRICGRLSKRRSANRAF